MDKITKNLQLILLSIILISTIIAVGIEIRTMFTNQSVTSAPFNTITISNLFAGNFELTTYTAGQAGQLSALIDIATNIDVLQPGPIVFPPPSPTVTDVSCFGGNGLIKSISNPRSMISNSIDLIETA